MGFKGKGVPSVSNVRSSVRFHGLRGSAAAKALGQGEGGRVSNVLTAWRSAKNPWGLLEKAFFLFEM